MVAALCGVLADAGARRIVIVESQFSGGTPEEVLGRGGWDIHAIRSAGAQRVTFEDTRNRGPWRNDCRLAVPWGGFIFPAFLSISAYEKTDVFISLAKLKEHINAGVTMSVKNLFGITPVALRHDKADENGLCGRGNILHYGKQTVAAGIPAEVDQKEPRNWRYRLPRVTADLFGAGRSIWRLSTASRRTAAARARGARTSRRSSPACAGGRATRSAPTPSAGR